MYNVNPKFENQFHFQEISNYAKFVKVGHETDPLLRREIFPYSFYYVSISGLTGKYGHERVLALKNNLCAGFYQKYAKTFVKNLGQC